MEVRCPQCTKQYNLDTAALSSKSARLQCSKCNHIFRVRLADKAKEETWMVRRKVDGKILDLDGLPTLQRWIVEREVSPDDELSRTGEHWKPLKAITELAAFFTVVAEFEKTSSGDHTAVSPNQAQTVAAAGSQPREEITAVGPRAEEVSANERNTVRASYPEHPAAQDGSFLRSRAASSSLQEQARLAKALLSNDAVTKHAGLADIVGAAAEPTQDPANVNDPDGLRRLLSGTQPAPAPQPAPQPVPAPQPKPTAQAVAPNRPAPEPVSAPRPQQPPPPAAEPIDATALPLKPKRPRKAPASLPSLDPSTMAPMSAPPATASKPAQPPAPQAPPDIGPTGAAWFVEQDNQPTAPGTPGASPNRNLQRSNEEFALDLGGVDEYVPRKKQSGAWLWVALVLIAAAGAGYYFLMMKPAADAEAARNAQNAQKTNAEPTDPAPSGSNGDNAPGEVAATNSVDEMGNDPAQDGASPRDGVDPNAANTDSVDEASDPNGLGGSETTDTAGVAALEQPSDPTDPTAATDPNTEGQPGEGETIDAGGAPNNGEAQSEDGAGETNEATAKDDDSDDGEDSDEEPSNLGFESLMKKGKTALRKDQPATAEGYFRKAVKEAPTNADARTSLGYALYDQGKYSSASKEFERARDRSPRYEPLYVGLGRSYEKMGRKSKAIAVYDAYLDAFPSGSDAKIIQRYRDKLSGDYEPPESTVIRSKETKSVSVVTVKKEPKKEEKKDTSSTNDSGKKVIVIKKKP